MQSLKKNYRWVEPCFEAMLKHWVERSSPPHSWSALVRALESPAIARGDIATSIKVSTILQLKALLYMALHACTYNYTSTHNASMLISIFADKSYQLQQHLS